MSRYLLYFFLLLSTIEAAAQTKSGPKDSAAIFSKEISPPVKTKGSVLINGARINYTATTGYLQLKTEEGKAKANFFFVAYTKDDVSDINKRPVTYTFNGGPGSSSVWLHMGVMGPKRIVMTDDGGSLPPPYSYVDNEYSWLDQTDLVFIDPVGTGYSRAAAGEDKAQFQGYTEDIESVGEFIRLYTTQWRGIDFFRTKFWNNIIWYWQRSSLFNVPPLLCCHRMVLQKISPRSIAKTASRFIKRSRIIFDK